MCVLSNLVRAEVQAAASDVLNIILAKLPELDTPTLQDAIAVGDSFLARLNSEDNLNGQH